MQGKDIQGWPPSSLVALSCLCTHLQMDTPHTAANTNKSENDTVKAGVNWQLIGSGITLEGGLWLCLWRLPSLHSLKTHSLWWHRAGLGSWTGGSGLSAACNYPLPVSLVTSYFRPPLPFFPFCHGLHPELEAKRLSPFNCYCTYFYLSIWKRNWDKILIFSSNQIWIKMF